MLKNENLEKHLAWLIFYKLRNEYPLRVVPEGILYIECGHDANLEKSEESSIYEPLYIMEARCGLIRWNGEIDEAETELDYNVFHSYTRKVMEDFRLQMNTFLKTKAIKASDLSVSAILEDMPQLPNLLDIDFTKKTRLYRLVCDKITASSYGIESFKDGHLEIEHHNLAVSVFDYLIKRLKDRVTAETGIEHLPIILASEQKDCTYEPLVEDNE